MTLIWRPGFQFDDDASTYIEAVEAADTQALETNTRYAINNFVIGCKSDGIWTAIKASCILAGARTLAGALVPLVGTAPTNNGFIGIGTDYERKTGLVGNGSSKYLDSNRNNNADPQDSKHLAVYGTTGTVNSVLLSTTSLNTAGDSYLYRQHSPSASQNFKVNEGGSGSSQITTNIWAGNFFGVSRTSSSQVVFRRNEFSETLTRNSATPLAQSLRVFGTTSLYSNARLAFYSIGEPLDLALLDARVTTLINAFAAAIP